MLLPRLPDCIWGLTECHAAVPPVLQALAEKLSNEHLFRVRNQTEDKARVQQT